MDVLNSPRCDCEDKVGEFGGSAGGGNQTSGAAKRFVPKAHDTAHYV